jgi:hypothetical protein
MADRCELCGARFSQEDQACRECGVARTQGVTPPSAEGPAPPPPFGVLTPGPTTGPPPPTLRLPAEAWVDADPTPSRATGHKRWMIGAGTIVAVATVLGVTLVASTDAPDGDATECPQLEQLAGAWTFTTEVIGAHSTDKLDMQGYYELVVELEGCTAAAKMTKLGFSGQDFTPTRQQFAEATLAEGAGGVWFGHGATFELRDSNDRGPDQEFVFVADDGRLSGVWRQRGSRWAKSGLHGFLEGHTDARASQSMLHLATQPCDVRCAIACDVLRRDGPPPSSAIDACRTTCAIAGSAVAVCGERRPLPETLRLALTGPLPTHEAHCGDTPCQLDPKLGRRRAPAVTPDSVDEGRMEVHLVEMGDAAQDDSTSLRLALRTTAGWFFSEPLRGGISDARLHERSLGQGEQRRLVIGTFGTSAASPRSTLVCRPDAPTPRCILVPGTFEPAPGQVAARVTPLPEDTLAVSSDDDVVLFGW